MNATTLELQNEKQACSQSHRKLEEENARLQSELQTASNRIQELEENKRNLEQNVINLETKCEKLSEFLNNELEVVGYDRLVYALVTITSCGVGID
jgi:chromosome segregation ATPase